MSKLPLRIRTHIAVSLYELVMKSTESFECSNIVGKDLVIIEGVSSIGVDLAYMMAAVLKDTCFEGHPDINALAVWLKKDYPDHPVHQFITWSDSQ